MTRIFILCFLIIHLNSFAQNCKCDSLFLQTQNIVEENYAGWFDKVTLNNKNAYNEWTAKHFSFSQKINTDSVCSKQLQEWISFFNDKHLRIKYKRPIATKNSNLATKEIQILSTNLTEKQINTYFSKTKKLDNIEGVYESSSYKLGITQVKPDKRH